MGARNYARLVQATGIASYNVPAASQCMDWLGERNIPGHRSLTPARSKTVLVAGLRMRRNSNGACREAARGPLPIFFTNPFLNFLRPFGEYNSPRKSLLQWDGRNLRSRK